MKNKLVPARLISDRAEIEDAIRKAETPDPDKIADEIYAALAAEFLTLPDKIEAEIRRAGEAGARKGLSEIGETDSGMIQEVNTLARDFAKERAAELVGMRITEDGELIQNPNAEWAITETTRLRLREIVKNAFGKETTMEEFIQAIQDADIFSEYRAEMIARTETALAQTNGNFEAWKVTGAVKSVTWLLSDDHETPDECDENDGEVVAFGDLFSSGDRMPPAHPNCWCVLAAERISAE